MRKILTTGVVILFSVFFLGASSCEYEEPVPSPTPTPVVQSESTTNYDYDAPDYEPPPEEDYGYSDTQYAGGDLDCADVSYEEAQVSVAQGDPNGFDADGDGEGCEWNR